MLITGFVEKGESEIGGFESRILFFTNKQKILWLKISMRNTKRMTCFYHLNNRFYKHRSFLLAVMTFFYNPIKQLTSGTELHNDVHRHGILICTSYLHHLWMFRKMMHYLNFPPHILVILLAQKFPLGDRLAGILIARRFLDAEICRPELTLPQFLPHGVQLVHILGLVWDDRCWSWHPLFFRRKSRFSGIWSERKRKKMDWSSCLGLLIVVGSSSSRFPLLPKSKLRSNCWKNSRKSSWREVSIYFIKPLVYSIYTFYSSNSVQVLD